MGSTACGTTGATPARKCGPSPTPCKSPARYRSRGAATTMAASSVERSEHAHGLPLLLVFIERLRRCSNCICSLCTFQELFGSLHLSLSIAGEQCPRSLKLCVYWRAESEWWCITAQTLH